MNETTEEIVLENYFNSSSFDTKSNGTVHSAISDFTAIVFAIGLSILAIVLHVKKEKFLESRNARYEEQRRIQQEEEDLKKKRACPETRKQAFSKLIETKTLNADGTVDSKIYVDTKAQEEPMKRDEKKILITDENNECAICLEKFEVGHKLSWSRTKNCHIYHEQCLFTWLMKNDCCPCCRVIFIDDKTLLDSDPDEVMVIEACDLDESGQESSIKNECTPTMLVDAGNSDDTRIGENVSSMMGEDDIELELGEFRQEPSSSGRQKRPKIKGLNYLEVNADETIIVSN